VGGNQPPDTSEQLRYLEGKLKEYEVAMGKMSVSVQKKNEGLKGMRKLEGELRAPSVSIDPDLDPDPYFTDSFLSRASLGSALRPTQGECGGDDRVRACQGD
jgi:hypothetical protein